MVRRLGVQSASLTCQKFLQTILSFPICISLYVMEMTRRGLIASISGLTAPSLGRVSTNGTTEPSNETDLLVIDSDESYTVSSSTSETYRGIVLQADATLQLDAGASLAIDSRQVAGDITGDGQVDIHDLTQLGQSWGTTEGDSHYDPAADLNDDSKIDIFDAVLLGQNWPDK